MTDELMTRDKAWALLTEYTKSDFKATRQIMEVMTYDMTETPEYRASMREMEEFMLKSGLIKKPIDWTKALGSQYLRQVDPALVK